MAQEIYMDIPAVENISKRLQDTSDVLKAVSNALEIGMTILKTTALVGLVGGTALAIFLDALKPIIDELAEKCTEISGDVAASARAFANGDAQGATRFH